MKRNNDGFSLAELLIAVGILSFAITGIVQLFIFCSTLSDLTANKTAAMVAAQDKLEEMRNYHFEDLVADYSAGGSKGDTFSLTEPEGMGKIYITDVDAYSDLLQVEIVVCFKNQFNRVVGEDLNLNGTLDAGEDTGASPDLKINSPVAIVSLIANM